MHHRTLCTANADDRGGRSRPLRTPCIASSSARARTPTLRRSPFTWTSAGRVCSIPSSSVSSPSERRRLRTSRRRPEGFRERRGSYSPSQAWYPTCFDNKVRVYSDEMSTASSPTTEPRAETGGGPGPSVYPRENPRTPAGGSAWPSGGQWRHHVPGDMPSKTVESTKTKVVVTKDLTLQSR